MAPGVREKIQRHRRIGAEFSVPPICGKDDVAPGGHSCITAAGKLIVK